MLPSVPHTGHIRNHDLSQFATQESRYVHCGTEGELFHGLACKSGKQEQFGTAEEDCRKLH
jgi:hypothetical protein